MSLNFRPKYKKIVELLLYLAHKKPRADKYQAVKFLYLADLEHFNRYGRPVTFETYFALDYGPVAEHALDLLNGKDAAFKAAGVKEIPFTIEAGKTSTGKLTTFIVTPKREIDRDIFSKSDLRIFDEILSKYGEYTFDQLYNLTHNHEAYKRAWNNKPFFARRAEMKYEDMLDENPNKDKIIEELEPVSEHLR